MASVESLNIVQDFYISFYQRPGDPSGLLYWAQRLDTGTPFKEVQAAFGNAQESQDLYGPINSSTIGDVIDDIYLALFNRAPDAAGKQFYIDGFNAGTFTPASIAYDILIGATGDDAVAVNNKQIVADRFSEAVDGRPLDDPNFGEGSDFAATYEGEADAVAAREMLAGVTSDPTTILSEQEVTEFIQKEIADPGDPILAETAGTTFTLKDGVDNIAGTANNDTVIGNSDTFDGLDQIDGAGGTDTFKWTHTGGLFLTGTLPTAVTVEDIENLEARGSSGALNADVQAWKGLKHVAVQQLAGSNVTVTSKSNVTGVAVTGTAANSTVTDSGSIATTPDTLASASFDGSTGNSTVNSDALTSLGVARTGGDTTVNAAAGTRALGVTVNELTSGADITDLTATSVAIDGMGASSAFNLNTAAAKSLTVAGDKGVKIENGLDALIKTITSTNTAGTTLSVALGNDVTFTGGDGKDSVTVAATTKAIAMGGGDDTVKMSVAVAVGGSVDGGAGTNTLSMTAPDAAAVSATAAFEAGVSNFQKLALTAAPGGTANTVNLANIDDINYVKTAGTAASSGTAEVQTITVTAPADANGGVVVVGGVNITIPSGASAIVVANTIAASAAAIILANPNIASVTSTGLSSVVTITYTTTSGPQAPITAVQEGSGVTFGPPVTIPPPALNPVAEQQTVTVGTAPGSSGTFSVGGVDVSVVLGDTVASTATKIAAALTATPPANVATAIAAAGVVTVTFKTTALNAPLLLIDNAVAVFGAPTVPVAAQSVAFVAGAPQTQTVAITLGTDVNGGEVIVGGANAARIALAGGLTVDDVGNAIVGQQAAILAGNPKIATVNYNTATDLLTFTGTADAGLTLAVTAVDNTTSGATLVVTDDIVVGIAGTAAGTLALTNMTTGGTLELTSGNGGAMSVAVKDAGLSSADVLNIKVNGTANVVSTAFLTVAGVENINVTLTDSTADTPVLTNPTAPSNILLIANEATTMVVSGNHGLNLSTSSLAKLVSLDASGVVANPFTGASSAAIGAAGAVWFASQINDKAVTILGGNGNDTFNTGSINDATFLATGVTSSTVDGGAGNDNISGGIGKDVLHGNTGNDTLFGNGGADTLTGGTGNDFFGNNAGTDSVLAKRDVITDFTGNSWGFGTGGAATSRGADLSDPTKVTGDVIGLAGLFGGGVTGIAVLAVTNAANAQTFLQNTGDAGTLTGIALDTSTGFFYIDLESNGTVSMVIEATGVTTIATTNFWTGL